MDFKVLVKCASMLLEFECKISVSAAGALGDWYCDFGFVVVALLLFQPHFLFPESWFLFLLFQPSAVCCTKVSVAGGQKTWHYRWMAEFGVPCL